MLTNCNIAIKRTHGIKLGKVKFNKGDIHDIHVTIISYFVNESASL
jgi:hypothetical protein